MKKRPENWKFWSRILRREVREELRGRPVGAEVAPPLASCWSRILSAGAKMTMDAIAQKCNNTAISCTLLHRATLVPGTQGPVENGGVDWEGEVGKYCKGARYRKVASYGGVEKGIPMLDVNEI